MTSSQPHAGPVGRAPRWRHRTRVQDSLLWGVMALPVVIGMLTPHPADTVWTQAVALVILWAVLPLSRRRPLAALVITVTLTMVHGNFVFAMPVISYLAGRRLERARPALTAYTTIFLTGTFLHLARGGGLSQWAELAGLLIILSTLPWLAGRALRLYRQLIMAGWERAEQVEREQYIRAERERLRERARIAEDMHDSLGHELTLIAVRASALQVTPGLAEPHRVAAAELRLSAATAIDRLHEIIGVLREEGTDRPGSMARTEPSARTVGELIARARASGMVVRVVHDGGDTEVPGAGPDADGENRYHAAPAPAPSATDTTDTDPADLDRVDLDQVDAAVTVGVSPMARGALHRVLQEGLTNAARHAPGAPVTVRPARTATHVVLTIDNDTPAGGPVPPVLAGAGGNGLIGLAERVKLAGGSMRAGPCAGGFTLAARLPLVPPVADSTASGTPVPPGAPGTLGPGAQITETVADAERPAASGPVAGVPGAADGTERVPPVTDSARRLLDARRRLRRRLAGAVLLPAALAGGLLIVLFAYHVHNTFDSVLEPADYRRLQVGQAEREVQRVLPGSTVLDPPDEWAGSVPAGAACGFYRPDRNILGRGDVYRLCFAGQRLVRKDVVVPPRRSDGGAP